MKCVYLELITGGPGSGKSGYVDNAIRQSIAQGRRALIIVPERFSHIEEKTVCENFGGIGENGIEVSTFSKLSGKLLKSKNYLSSAGRKILIMKAAKKKRDAGDGVFSSSCERNGFLSELSSAISELKRNLVMPEDLINCTAGGLLEKKMHALGEIYAAYNNSLSEGFHDPDEDMEHLAKAILSSDDFGDTDVYIDGFSDFLPSHYAVIEALISKFSGVYVTLMITDSGLRDDEGVFSVVKRSVTSLEKIAASLGAACKRMHFDQEPSYIEAPDICYFIKTYDEYNPAYEKPKAENIRVVRLNDRHEEVSYLAGRIMHEVRDNGLRFREIGVIAGKLDSYEHIINAVFEEAGISYFSDKKTAANEHAVIRLVLSVFRILKEDWSHNAVFEYLRSGFVYEKTKNGVRNIPAADVDKLDIYVKSRGIRGKRLWLSEDDWKSKRAIVFDTSEKEENAEFVKRMDSIRRSFTEPFLHFYGKIKGKQKVKSLCTALYEFLEEIYLFEGITIETKKLEAAGMLEDAARLSSVWNCLIETLEQCVLTSGEEYVSREDFSLMLEAGLSECSLDTVPTGIDCVNVLDASDSRPIRVKVLFVLGALRGEFPVEVSDGGLINDKERAELSIYGFDALPDAASKNAVAEFNIFHSLTGAVQRLYISYPQSNDDNSKNMPCELISEIIRTFPEIEEVYPDEEEMMENLFALHKSTYYKMLSRLVEDIPAKERLFWENTGSHIRNTFADGERTYYPMVTDNGVQSIFDLAEYKSRNIFELVDEYKRPDYSIRPQTAQKLYELDYMSITSMQMFNKCPFSHFIKYGLKISPEEEYTLKSYELGQVIHHAINEFCNEVQRDASTLEEKRKCWEQLDKDAARKIINMLMEEIENKAKLQNTDFAEEKIEAICKRAERTIEKTVDIICESITKSGFSACDFEKEFKVELKSEGETAGVCGKIDRIDAVQTEEGTYLRIIDYKTGHQEFKISGICNMTDIQLILYAMAAEDLYKNENARASAVLYNKVREELSVGNVSLSVNTEPSMLDGIIITEQNPEDTQGAEIVMHDKMLGTGGAQSSYLPIKTKLNGCLYKGKSAVSREKFKKLEEFVANGVIKTKKAVFGGDISVSPLTAPNSSPCKYCGYEQICLFNSDRDTERNAVTSEATAWKIIGGEDSDE